MALQAQQVHLAHAQETRVGGAVGRMTTGAAFRLHRHMLIHKRAVRVGMALDANGVSAGQGPDLAEGGGAVNVVAVAALNQAFVYAMVIRLGKLSFGGSMTSVAEVGSC